MRDLIDLLGNSLSREMILRVVMVVLVIDLVSVVLVVWTFWSEGVRLTRGGRARLEKKNQKIAKAREWNTDQAKKLAFDKDFRELIRQMHEPEKLQQKVEMEISELLKQIAENEIQSRRTHKLLMNTISAYASVQEEIYAHAETIMALMPTSSEELGCENNRIFREAYEYQQLRNAVKQEWDVNYAGIRALEMVTRENGKKIEWLTLSLPLALAQETGQWVAKEMQRIQEASFESLMDFQVEMRT